MTSVSPRVIPGRLWAGVVARHTSTSSSSNCAVWGTHHNLLAYACGHVVCIVDTVSSQLVQTLDEHRAPVTVLDWSPFSLDDLTNVPTQWCGGGPLLASGDNNGVVNIWDVRAGAAVLVSSLFLREAQGNNATFATMTEWSSVAVRCIKWHPTCMGVVAVILGGNWLTLWRVTTSVALLLWSCNYNKLSAERGISFDPLLSLTWDPFHCDRALITMEQGWIFLLQGLPARVAANVPTTGPVNKDRTDGADGEFSLLNATTLQCVIDTPQRYRLQSGESDCLRQVLFAPWTPSIIVYVTQRRVFMADLATGQIVGTTETSKQFATLDYVILYEESCQWMLGIHTNGVVSMWMSSNDLNASERIYVSAGMFDVCKSNKLSFSSSNLADVAIAGMAVCCRPSQLSFAVVLMSGKVLIWGPSHTLATSSVFRCDRLNEIISMTAQESCICHHPNCHRTHTSFSYRHLGVSLSSYFSKCTMLLAGAIDAVASPITALQCCPFSPAKCPLAAVGSGGGRIQVIALTTSAIVRDIVVVAKSAIRDIKWIDATTVVCYAVAEGPSVTKASMLYLNTVSCVCVLTGRVTVVRAAKEGGETAPIRGLRISPSARYMVLLFKDRDFELWTLRMKQGSQGWLYRSDLINVSKETLLEMKQMSPVTALEWVSPNQDSPEGPLVGVTSPGKPKQVPESMGRLSVDQSTDSGDGGSGGGSGGQGISSDECDIGVDLDDDSDEEERFVFTSPHGVLRMYTVGRVSGVVDVSRASRPLSSDLGVVTALAARGHIVVSGDTRGELHYWDYKLREHKAFKTGRGIVRRIRFSPSTYNNHVITMLGDGAEWGVFDLDQSIRLSSSDSTLRGLIAVDVDWATSSNPIVALHDGSLRIYDLSLHFTNSSVNHRSTSTEVHIPQLLPTRYAACLKTMIQMGMLVQTIENKENNEDNEIKETEGMPSMLQSSISLLATPSFVQPSLASSSLASFETPPKPSVGRHGDDGGNSIFKESSPNHPLSPIHHSYNAVIAGLHIDITSSCLSSPFLHPVSGRRTRALLTRYAEAAGLAVVNALSCDAIRSSTARRCAFAAYVFGQVNEWKFWTVVDGYLRYPCTSSPSESSMPDFPSSVGYARPSEAVRHDFLHRVITQDRQRGSVYITSQQVAASYCLLGLPNLALSVYMDAAFNQPHTLPSSIPPSSTTANGATIGSSMLTDQVFTSPPRELEDAYRSRSFGISDALRSCLMSALVSPQCLSETVQTVAMSVIATGDMDDGLALLASVDCVEQCAHFLQRSHRWLDAVVLAKCRRHDSSAITIDTVKALAMHLLTKAGGGGESTSDPVIFNSRPSNAMSLVEEALLLFISIGEWASVVTVLSSYGMMDRIVWLVQAYEEALGGCFTLLWPSVTYIVMDAHTIVAALLDERGDEEGCQRLQLMIQRLASFHNKDNDKKETVKEIAATTVTTTTTSTTTNNHSNNSNNSGDTIE